MYIEDISKPFLVLEGKKLTEEEFYLSGSYAAAYFFRGRARRRLGIVCCVLFAIQLVSTAAALISSPSDFNYQHILVPIFLMLFILMLLVFFPNADEKRIKTAYESSEYLRCPNTLRFYKEYFEWENEKEYIKIARTDIDRCLESRQMILLKRKDGIIFTIMKDWMTENELITLREYLHSVYVAQYKAVE